MEKVYVVVFEADHESSLGAFKHLSNAEKFCEEHDWMWIDENMFDWALEIIEDCADNWVGYDDEDDNDLGYQEEDTDYFSVVAFA